jgi:hypothetical protein
MNMTVRMLRQCGVALMLLTTGLQAIPQQTAGRYTVEIVVFRTDGDASGEDGAAAAPLRSTAGDIMPTPVPGRRLAGAVAKLRSAGGYRILAHTAWSQVPAAWNSRRGVSVEQLGINTSGISGNVVLERGQYLHLGVDLKVEDGGRSFVLADLRRVKLDEAQYFDHPQLGVIALVTSGGAAP